MRSEVLYIHDKLTDLGIEVASVSMDGRVEFVGQLTEKQRADAVNFLQGYKTLTREEAMQEIAANREALIDKFLFNHYYSFVAEAELKAREDARPQTEKDAEREMRERAELEIRGN